MSLHDQLKWFKKFRCRGNILQKEAYRSMLKFMHKRLNKRRFVAKEEVKLFDLAKIFLEGGWVFEEESLSHSLAIAGIE